MDTQRLVEQAKRISIDANEEGLVGSLSEASEFLRQYAGENSSFYKNLADLDHRHMHPEAVLSAVKSSMQAFIRYVENGLLDEISIERSARITVVSDFLAEAQFLLDDPKVHPAATTMLIGASLEEFLRNWVEDANLSIGDQKPSIQAYMSVLRRANLITAQDAKDITGWGGNRNHAAHGEWDQVADRERIRNMLDGVNLFMRRYGAK